MQYERELGYVVLGQLALLAIGLAITISMLSKFTKPQIMQPLLLFLHQFCRQFLLGVFSQIILHSLALIPPSYEAVNDTFEVS